ncbi:MAG: FGGY family carbohydrate kinase [Bacteroidota bacterium]|nr:FGGY family carbohydrate kinase [Bacteroidota bacterium]MDP4233338.1 FGGY family carbohydrate kinase [Bacteroidota bacterium]MDP4242205.1 FGGY family carbohydrate kinase [Bacteroidota bacterium]MDP4286961.1 FGGY family carbohydrate kinase [Bacteroidota bacterium]
MRAVIGIDVGSSAIKGTLVAEGTVLHTDRLPIPARLPTAPEFFEHDPLAIRDAAFEIISKLAGKTSELGLCISALAFTGQMHGGLVVDRRLRPLTNFVTWQDKRCTAMLPKLETQFGEDPTGLNVRNGFLLTTLAWWNRHGALPNGSAYVLGIYDWLTSLLAGHAVTDITSAAAWAMFDPIRKEWRHAVFDSFGIPQSLLPDVFEPGAWVGQVEQSLANVLGLPLDTAVHASIGDTQAAYLGAGCTSTDLLLNFGTGSQSMWETTTPLASRGTDIRYLMRDRFLVTVPTLAGGEAYRTMALFIQDVLSEFEPPSGPSERLGRSDLSKIFALMDRLACGTSSHGIHFDPIFAGSKFRPEGERASIVGLTRENFLLAPLLRALVEGMIEEIAAPYFERESRMRHQRLIGAGSGMRSNQSLREAAEQRFGLPISVSRVTEEAALGAAMLCG